MTPQDRMEIVKRVVSDLEPKFKAMTMSVVGKHAEELVAEIRAGVARTSARLTKIGETLDRIGGTPTPTAAAKPAAVEEESDGPEYPRIRMLKGRKIAKTLERARMNALLENSKLAEVRTARAQRIAELDGEIAHLEGLIDGASR